MTELPAFSECVERALRSGNIKGALWQNMIMQAAAFYSNNPKMHNKTEYNTVGRMMFDKYPAIEVIGTKPWSHFTKCLSQRIRSERLRIKLLKQKDFPNLVSTRSDIQRVSSRKKVYIRQNVKCKVLSMEENEEIRNKLQIEYQNKGEKSMIKSLLLDTFAHRTELLDKKTTFMEDYLCFKDAEYFIYEFRILIGRTQMIEAQEKLKEFFKKIGKYYDSDFAFLMGWTEFETKTGIFHSKENLKPIIKVVKDTQNSLMNMPKSAFHFLVHW